MLTSGKTSKNWIPSKKQSREIYSPHAAVIWTTLFSWSKDLFLRWKDRIDQQESYRISYLSQLLVNTCKKKKVITRSQSRFTSSQGSLPVKLPVCLVFYFSFFEKVDCHREKSSDSLKMYCFMMSIKPSAVSCDILM